MLWWRRGAGEVESGGFSGVLGERGGGHLFAWGRFGYLEVEEIW